MSTECPEIRAATLEDVAAIELLIARSAHELSSGDYSREQVDGALRGAFGVDTQLLRDGTYFVACCGAELVGCGGWSYRRTLFGGDARADRDPQALDPRTDAAKIRAFFVHPAYARRGIGTALLARCESEARNRGFRRFELMATLPGVRLYRARGYQPGKPLEWPVPGNLTIRFVPMCKELTARELTATPLPPSPGGS
jgi:GNAT superfamily N-acetyltransferase